MSGISSAYQFNLATTDYGINSNVALLSANSWACITWVYPIATTAGRWIMSKNTASNARARILRLDAGDGTKLSGFVSQSPTTPLAREVVSVTGTIKAGVWQFIAEVYNDLSADRQIHLYVGTDKIPAAEVTYGATMAVTDPGFLTPDGAFNIANRIGGTDVLSFPGYIGPMCVIEGQVPSLKDINDIQKNFYEALRFNPTLFTFLGKNGTGKSIDESGHNNHITFGGGATSNFNIPRILPLRTK